MRRQEAQEAQEAQGAQGAQEAQWRRKTGSAAAAASAALAAAAFALLSGSAPSQDPVPVPPSTVLSPFRAEKARQLLESRLACLGCHAIDGAGGRIGPDLSRVGERRSAEFIRRVIEHPDSVVPGTVMPRMPLSPATLSLIAQYLAERGGPIADERVAPSSTNPPAPRGPRAPPQLYGRFCAPCHGATGRGEGENAPYLPVRPSAHADSAYMSTRPDDALYDAIAAGGYVMNRSNMMPAFGMTLSSAEIRGLVGYLRELCRCRGPEWSRDGSAGGSRGPDGRE